MDTDPNWLLSTTAQCTAAFVAIVGGLLVSRLVAISTERQGIRRQLDGLHRRRDALDSDVRSMAESVAGGAEKCFFALAVDDYVRSRGQIPHEASLYRHRPPGATEEQLRRWSTMLAEDVAEVFNSLDSARSPTDPSPRVSTHFDRNALLRLITAFTAGESSRRKRPNSRRPSPEFPTPQLVAAQEALLKNERELIGALKALDTEIELREEQLSRLAATPHVWSGIGLLAAFAIAGAIVPLAMLSRRPVPHSPAVRTTVVIAFAFGVLAVFTYLAVLVRALQFDEGRPSTLPLHLDQPESSG